MQQVLIVALANEHEQNGGAERYVSALSASFPPGEAELWTAFRYLHRRAPLFGLAKLQWLEVIYRAARVVRRSQADIVDVHFPALGIPVVLFSRRSQVCIFHFQGPWAVESALEGEGHFSVIVKQLIERFVARKSRDVIVLTQESRHYAIDYLRVPAWKVHCIAPGVDLGRFRPHNIEASRLHFGLPVDAIVVGCIRRLVNRMGIEDLISAWAENCVGAVSRQILVIAGTGPLRADLEALVAKLRLDHNVVFLGRLDDDQVPIFLSACNFTVVPSRAAEGFGLVVLESLGCGTPVLVTDVGGLREAVGALAEQLVVPANSPQALSDRIGKACQGVLPSGAECNEVARAMDWHGVYKRHAVLMYPSFQRTKVLIFDHCPKLSGGEIALSRILANLTVSDVHVLLGSEGPLVEMLRGLNVGVSILPLPTALGDLEREQALSSWEKSKLFTSAFGYAFHLRRLIRRWQPDLAHANSLKAALLLGVSAFGVGVRWSWHIHEPLSSSAVASRRGQLIAGFAGKGCTAIIANSAATLSSVRAEVPSFVIPGSYSEHQMLGSPRELSSAHRSTYRIGCIGTIAPSKGQDVFVRGLSIAIGRVSRPIRASIIGAPIFGSEEFALSLRVLVDELHLEQEVTFLGFRNDIPKLLSNLDVLVMSSVVPEGFGLVLIEAMVSGVSVVAPAMGGPAELVTNERGWPYSAGSSAALGEALVACISNPEERKRRADSARDWAILACDPVRVTEAVEVVWRSASTSDKLTEGN